MIKRIDSSYFIEKNGELSESLPVGVYNLCYNERLGFYLEKTNDFSFPKKLYGDYSTIDRWVNTYESFKREGKSLGVLLSGIKGAGKTITAKLLSKKVNQPVIIINNSFQGAPGFESFLSNPSLGNCTIFIDEFEKIFYNDDIDAEDQKKILSILDGSAETRHLYILTVNDTDRMSDYLMNRPGRIRYRKHYDSLDKSIIDEIADDYKLSKEEKESLFDVLDMLDYVTFDIVMTLIVESKMYNELPKESAKHLNLIREKSYINICISPKDVTGKTTRYVIRRNETYHEIPFYEKDKETGKYTNSWKELDYTFEEIERLLRKNKYFEIDLNGNPYIIKEDKLSSLIF